MQMFDRLARKFIECQLRAEQATETPPCDCSRCDTCECCASDQE